MWGNKKGINNKHIDTLIGKATEISGDLHFAGGMVIDGRVTGNIVAIDDDNATLTITENGYVEGQIQTSNIIINGTVIGDVYANNRIELAKKARIHGNVYYHLIEMAVGSEVNGNLVHFSEDEKLSHLEAGQAQPRLAQPEKQEGSSETAANLD